MNVFAEEWDEVEDWSGGGGRSRRLPRSGELGATVYELGRTAEGERVLAEGEVVHFPIGPDGAHGISNATEEPVRYVVTSTNRLPEVAEYPDLKQITAQARTASQTGERLWLIHDVEGDAR
jgi:uncharacterized cupin superfamily protein